MTQYCFGANSGKMVQSLKITKRIYLFISVKSQLSQREVKINTSPLHPLNFLLIGSLPLNTIYFQKTPPPNIKKIWFHHHSQQKN